MFQMGSNETILQFWSQVNYTAIASMANASWSPYAATNSGVGNLVDAFAVNDARKNRFLREYDDTTYFPNKYLNNFSDHGLDQDENLIVFKLDEVYLNRAEAYANSNNTASAVSDLNVLRSRAGLSGISSNINGNALMDTVIAERRRELCFEWSDRWITLKRNNKIDQVMGSFKPSVWKSMYQVLPIPLTDIQRSNLTQNQGYN